MQNSEIVDKALDNVLNTDGVHETGTTNNFMVQGFPFFHKGFYIQCFSPDGLHWKGWAKPRHISQVKEFESRWHLSEHDAGKQLVQIVDIYTEKAN